MREVSLEEAYREACTALGEEVIRARLLGAEVDQLRQRAETLQAVVDARHGDNGDLRPDEAGRV